MVPGNSSQPAPGRRRAMLALACAIAWSGCYQTWEIWTDCPPLKEEDGEEETIPPCYEASDSDAGRDADAEAEDASGD